MAPPSVEETWYDDDGLLSVAGFFNAGPDCMYKRGVGSGLALAGAMGSSAEPPRQQQSIWESALDQVNDRVRAVLARDRDG